MKKIQLPAIGGIRKVIQPGATVAAGTTIAELGANTITLAQLAQLITQIQKQQVNTGGGNVGDGTEAVLIPGPGLSGGGPMLGAVPIRLTAPIPWGLDDGGGGGDGDPGPPGAAGAAGAPGAQGAAGATGPAVFLDAEPGEDGLWAVPGPVGPTGATGATGATGPQGPSGSGTGGGAGTLLFWVPEESWPDDPIYRMPSQLGPLTINGVTAINGSTTVNGTESIINGNLVFDAGNNRNITFLGPTPTIQATAGAAILAISANATGAIRLGVNISTNIAINSNGATTIQGAGSGAQQLLVAPSAAGVPGIICAGGNTSANSCMIWQTFLGVQLAQLFGDGGLTLGPSTLTDMTTGTVNVSKGYFVNGLPLGQTFGAGVYPYLLGDGDNYNDDQGFFAPNPTTLGPMVFNGQVTANAPNFATAIIANGSAGAYTEFISASPAAANSFGLLVRGGTGAGDTAMLVQSQSGGATFLNILGDGHGTLGPTNLLGLSWSAGGVMVIATPSSGTPLTINGASGAYTEFVSANSLAGNSFGLLVRGGTTSTDTAILVQSQSGGATFLNILGDGHGTLGASGTVGAQWAAGGAFTFSSSVSILGATPATATASQTDLGNTTTGTVITTAGGIALPALASTFWRINVNGVAYGIPLFAL